MHRLGLHGLLAALTLALAFAVASLMANAGAATYPPPINACNDGVVNLDDCPADEDLMVSDSGAVYRFYDQPLPGLNQTPEGEAYPGDLGDDGISEDEFQDSTGPSAASTAASGQPCRGVQLPWCYIPATEGFDTRNQFPRNAIVKIVFGPPDNAEDGFCTGFMISKDTVATAAHCAYAWGSRRFVAIARVQFAPSKDLQEPSRDMPPLADSCGVVSPNGALVPAGYKESRTDPTAAPNRHDYAALKLDCDVGPNTQRRRVGILRLVHDPRSRRGLQARLLGFVRPTGATDDDPHGMMWRSIGTIEDEGPNRLFYSAKTLPGMSGAPLYRKYQPCARDGQPPIWCAMAIHTDGPPPNSSGLRITQVIHRNLDWFADCDRARVVAATCPHRRQ
jgi:V8-like Glu-specific endopeptidase